MTSREKIAIGVLILIGLISWWVIAFRKDLNDFLFYYWLSYNPQILSGEIALEKQLKELELIRKKDVKNLQIEAKAAVSVFINNEGEKRILFEKEMDKKLPIASLTKLMTAFIVLKHYDLSEEIKISKEAIEQMEDFGGLKSGQIFSTEHLLYPLLIESSNDAAFVLSNDYIGMTEEKFVELMNLKAQKINMNNTFFVNSTGLDSEEPEAKITYSTATDLVKLTKELFKKPLIWKILSTPKYNLYGPELINTNELLGEIPGIKGGKTGFTKKAGECLLLVLEAPENRGYLINVILGTTDRFDKMKQLIEWVEQAYRW